MTLLLYHIILYLSIEKHKKTLILSIFFSFFSSLRFFQKSRQKPKNENARTAAHRNAPASSPPFPHTRTRARMRPRPHICTHAHAPARFYFSSLFFRLCSLLLLSGLPSSSLLPFLPSFSLLPSPFVFGFSSFACAFLINL